MALPDLEDVHRAADRIGPHVHRTPVARSAEIDEALGARVAFKCENLQKVGAFKARGALNAVLSLDADRRARGVVTHSSGNHAAALAWAARSVGVDCTVVMPDSAPRIKVDAVRGYGASIVFCKQSERAETCERVRAGSGATLVHPYDDPAIVAGQGTAALELIEDEGPFDLVIAPVGGGGLLAGTAIATRGLLPDARVRGAEPERVDDAHRSLASGVRCPAPDRPCSWADGLLTGLGELPFAVLREHRVRVVTVGEEAILDAARTMLERLRQVVEPSAATVLAALRSIRETIAGASVGAVISGGNTDFAWLAAALREPGRD